MTISKQQLIHEVRPLRQTRVLLQCINSRINLIHVPDVPESEIICQTICEVLNVKLSDLKGKSAPVSYAMPGLSCMP